MKHLLAAALASLVFGCGSSVGSGSSGGGSSTTGSTGTGTGGAGGASSAVTATGSTSTGGGCAPACDLGFTCCGTACVNLSNDIKNCGTCGQTCLGDQPFCGAGTCGDPPCDAVVVCSGTQFCCGSSCCDEGMLCCEVQGPGPSGGPACTAPENGTCPRGCPTCE